MATDTQDGQPAPMEHSNAAAGLSETSALPQPAPRAASSSRKHTTTSHTGASHPNARFPNSASKQAVPSRHANVRPLATWLPVALKWPYLCSVLTVTILILSIVIALHVQSARDSGLGNDNESRGTHFLSKFLPTVVAVCYVFSLSVRVDDIKRTEPYARSASTAGASATNTLFWSAGPWWATLYDSLPNKKRGQGFRCAMFCASLAFILGFLVLSPFSSTFLATQDVTFSQDLTFGQLPLLSNLYSPIECTGFRFSLHGSILSRQRRRHRLCRFR